MPKWVKLWVCQGLSYNLLILNMDWKPLADTPSARAFWRTILRRRVALQRRAILAY